MSTIIPTSAGNNAMKLAMARTPGVGAMPEFGSVEAKLWIFPPRNLSQQVLRPYTYKFSQAFAEALTEATDMVKEVGPMGTLYNDDRLNNAILPNSNGIPLDVRALCDCWTGIILVDVGKPDAMGILPNTRTIYSGIFTEEPCHPNPVWTSELPLNPRALFEVTHRCVVNMHTGYGPHGMTGGMPMTLDDSDVIFQSIAQLPTTDDNLLVIAPHRLRMATSRVDNDTNLVDWSNTSVASLSNTNEILPNRMKAPFTHLRSIVKNIDYARSLQNNGMCYGQELDAQAIPGDPYQQFATRVDNGLCSEARSSFIMHGQLDIKQMYTLEDIERIFPNIEATYLDIPYHQEYDVSSQMVQNPATTMSSMIIQTVGAMASSIGIATISFRYCSWQCNNPMQGPGIYELIEDPNNMTGDGHAIGMLVESTDQQIATAWNALTRMMEQDLFPILKTIGGEFDLMIHYDIQGETFCWFEYKDMPSGMDGFYQTNTRFGGVLNPMLGNYNNLNNNQTQLQNLTGYIAQSTVGSSELF